MLVVDLRDFYNSNQCTTLLQSSLLPCPCSVVSCATADGLGGGLGKEQLFHTTVGATTLIQNSEGLALVSMEMNPGAFELTLSIYSSI